MIREETVLVGADPEAPVMLRGGEAFPVTGFIPGTKKEPAQLEGLPKGFMVQQDNVNVEFNVPPAGDMHTFKSNIRKAMYAIEKMLPPTMYVAWNHGSTVYKKHFLNHDAVLRFGCDPDYCVWTGEENPMPEAQNPLLRSAAGHVHVGWENPTNEDRMGLVRMLDLSLALPFVGQDDVKRKELYGRAGAFRAKAYGIEYRVLGNFWLGSHEEIVHSSVMRAVALLNKGVTLTKEECIAMIEAINKGKHSNTSREMVYTYVHGY